MHANRTTFLPVGALTAQLTTVAAHAEAREAKTITTGRRLPDHDEHARWTANGIVGQVDVERVLGEFAGGSSRSLHLDVWG